MQTSQWFFVDESGDPTFYGKKRELLVGNPGCSPIFIIGFICSSNPRPLRKAVTELQQQIVNDPYFYKEPFIHRTAISLHAKDDLPETRYLMFELLSCLDFKAQVIVARKIEHIFIEKDNAKQNSFYDHIVGRLFERALHLYPHNTIIFSKRGSKSRQQPLQQAIEHARTKCAEQNNINTSTTLDIQSQIPSAEPCLSIVDYVNWAIYKAFVDQEMRFFHKIESKVQLIADIYDIAKKPLNWYNRRNPFDIKKITPLPTWNRK